MKKFGFANVCLSVLAIFLMLYALILPEKSADAARRALSVFSGAVLPSLVLFSVSAKLLVKSGMAEAVSRLPLRGLCFSLGVSPAGLSAVALGAFTGFPTGASVLAELCARGSITKREAESLLPFCNQAGASFLIGTVGAGFFSDARIGTALFLAQTASVFVGLALTSHARLPYLSFSARQKGSTAPFFSVLTSSVSESALAMLSVCGYVVFFSLCVSAVSDMAMLFGFSLGVGACTALGGVLEISSGLSFLAELSLPDGISVTLAGVMVGFGGLSVFLQAADRTEKLFFSPRRYFGGKALSVFLCAAFARSFFGFYERNLSVLWLFLMFIAVIFAFCILIYLKNKVFFKKVWKNEKECCII